MSVEAEEIRHEAFETARYDVCWNVVACSQHSAPYSRDRELYSWQPQEKNVNAITSSFQISHDVEMALCGQRGFEAEIDTLPREILDFIQH
jgi:hypothetical protein